MRLHEMSSPIVMSLTPRSYLSLLYHELDGMPAPSQREYSSLPPARIDITVRLRHGDVGVVICPEEL